VTETLRSRRGLPMVSIATSVRFGLR